MSFIPSEFISQKQRKLPHSEGEIYEFIARFMDGSIPDYQMAAWLMAVYFQGMTIDETVALTKAFIKSGHQATHSGIKIPIGDKHSTGGVGDKISLHLAPLLAAAGMAIPTITGRGLGFTGGTLDKLESIPGFRTDLSLKEFEEFTVEHGLAFGAQTEEIVPADKRIYALRDVTSTVKSYPLIVSSILSKKVAEGIQSIVFDVKCGSGAYMETLEEAKELSTWLVQTASRFNLNAAALITAMDQPLGFTIGNWLEMEESIKYLKREVAIPDVHELTLAIGGVLLHLAGLAETPENGECHITEVLNTGSGLKKLREIMGQQDGDVSILDGVNPYSLDSQWTIYSQSEGYICEINAREIGISSMLLGAGRMNAKDTVKPEAGIRLLVKVGDPVKKNQPLAILYSDKETLFRSLQKRVLRAFYISEIPPEKLPLVRMVITSSGESRWDDFRHTGL